MLKKTNSNESRLCYPNSRVLNQRNLICLDSGILMFRTRDNNMWEKEYIFPVKCLPTIKITLWDPYLSSEHKNLKVMDAAAFKKQQPQFSC